MDNGLRKCMVEDKMAFFHGCYQMAEPIAPGAWVGSHPGGQLAYPVAVVEMADGSLTTAGLANVRFIEAAAGSSQDAGKALTAPWIPMSDRHPPTDGSYIIHTAKGAVCTAHYWGREKRFSGRGIQATHWMPLPKPPAGDYD